MNKDKMKNSKNNLYKSNQKRALKVNYKKNIITFLIVAIFCYIVSIVFFIKKSKTLGIIWILIGTLNIYSSILNSKTSKIIKEHENK